MTTKRMIQAVIACLGVLAMLFVLAACGITENFKPDMTPEERSAEIQVTVDRIDAVLKLVDVDLRKVVVNPQDWPAVRAKILEAKIKIEGYKALMEILIGAKNVSAAFTERYTQIMNAIDQAIAFYDNRADALEQEARQRAPIDADRFQQTGHVDTPSHWMLEHPAGHIYQEISF